MIEPASKPHAAMSGETPGIDADLERLQHDTFGYFLHETNPANGLVSDKTAEVPNGPWRGIEEVECATLEWVDWFNTRRLLAPIGNIPPVEFEARYAQSQESPTTEAGLN